MSGLNELITWTISKGLSVDDLGDLLEGLAGRLTEMGYSLVRASIAMPSIDPTQRGFSIAWFRSSGLQWDVQGHGEEGEALFRRSPISFLLANQLEFVRWTLPGDADTPDFPVLLELADLGATEFVMKLAPFPGGTALAGLSFSLAVDHPGGFSDQQIADFESLLPSVALACCRIATTRVAKDVLAVYTGDRTSDRILSGQTRRGDGAAIYAAILFADLKNFTSLNEQYQPEQIVGWLNDHFEAIGQPVVENGGEILKFMGDSLLAIFTADVAAADEACGRALAAAEAAMAANEALNRSRKVIGEPEIPADIVLHLGEIFYGNVGAARRLDFTIIGRAVNEAARIEKLADEVGYSLLASAEFASHIPAGFESVGRFALKGVAAPAEIFAWKGRGG